MGDLRAPARALQYGSLAVLLLLLPVSKAAIEIAFPLLLIGWLLEHGPQRFRDSVWRKPSSRSVRAALVAFLAVCALSVVSSTHPDMSLKGLLRKTLEYALLFVIAADLGSHEGCLRRSASLLLASSFVVALDAVAQELFGVDPLRWHRLSTYGRMTGPYENPTDLATFFMVVLPILLACLNEGAARWRRWGLAALLIGCLIRTGAEGAWLGLLAGLAVLAIQLPRTRLVLLIGAASLAVLIGGWLLAESWVPAAYRFREVVNLSEAGRADRMYMWQAGWNMMLDRPWLGHGLNTFMENYLKFWVGGEWQPRYAHNCYLQMGAETGLIGLGTFLTLLGWLMARLFSSLPRTAAAYRPALIGCTAGLVGFLVQAAVDTNFYAMRQAVLFWTLAGLSFGRAIHDTAQS